MRPAIAPAPADVVSTTVANNASRGRDRSRLLPASFGVCLCEPPPPLCERRFFACRRRNSWRRVSDSQLVATWRVLPPQRLLLPASLGVCLAEHLTNIVQ